MKEYRYRLGRRACKCPAFGLHFLCGRDVVFLPDANGVEKWQAAAEALRPYCAEPHSTSPAATTSPTGL